MTIEDLSNGYSQLLPERGERVEVSDYKDFSDKEVRIFLTKIEGAFFPFQCVENGYEEEYAKGNKFGTLHWKYMRRIPQKPEIEVTVKVNGKEVEPSKISKETWEGLRDEKE